MAKIKKKRITTENQVYRCTWKKRGKVFELKCIFPVVTESASADLERAKEDLWAQIMDATGDGEPVLQFVPPLPEATRKKSRFLPEYYHVECNELVDWARERQHDLFVGGVCKRCGVGLGMRTETQRLVTSLPRYDIVGFRKDQNLRTMYSDVFLNHIMPFATAGVRLIEVKFEDAIQKRLRGKRYHEVDFSPGMQIAVPRANDGFGSSFRCLECGRQHFFFSAKKLRAQYSTYLVRSLAHGRVLFIGSGSGRVIAVDAKLHERIASDKRVKGFLTDRLVLLDDNEALSEEELRSVKIPSP
jgi:hypothetical protein